MSQEARISRLGNSVKDLEQMNEEYGNWNKKKPSESDI